MPLPWKKNRVPRISQIVADLQSPKRGASLVVETGFPTSLIDLFVKNRSRFKKSKSTKTRRSDPPPAPPPSPPEPSSSSDGLEICAQSNTEAASVRQLVRETVHEDDAADADAGRGIARVGKCVGGRYADIVVAASLKVFAVIVLTLSAKKLTVGITMSAFALLFVEYAGKHIVSCLNLKPCSNANMAFRSFWFQKIAFKRRQNYGSSEQEAIIHEAGDQAVVCGLVGKVKLCSAYASSSNIIEEIKVVEARGDSDTNIPCELTSFDKKWVCPDDSKGKVVEQYCEISECYTRKSSKRSATKLKSKMVNILVKLRALKKEKKKKSKKEEAESNSEDGSSRGGDKSARLGIEDDGITCSSDSLLIKEVGLRESDEEGRRIVYSSGGNSGYIILTLIALAGLVGGRILALLFTMAWCFILKMVRTRGT